jgi:nucleotide-binding universal stress UspA family protein
VSFRRILIAVDEQPVSVRAAEVGAELARSLGGGVALIHVNDPTYPGDTGIPPKELIARAEEDSKRLLAGFRQRLSLHAMLGSVAEGVMRNAPSPVLVVRAQI